MITHAKLAELNRHIARLEAKGGAGSAHGDRCGPGLSLGHADMDAHFAGGPSPGGLAWGSHQLAGSEGDFAAPRGFGFMLLARHLAAYPAAHGLIVQEASAIREAGASYAVGLHALGLDPGRLTFLRTQHGADALRAVNETLRARVPAILLVELCDGAALADLSVTRRFNLAALKAQALVLLVTPDLAATSAALSRWRVACAPSLGVKRQIGAPTLSLDLVRNRHGRTGRWTLEWSSHDRVFRSVRGAEFAQPAQSSKPAQPARTAPAMAASLVSPAFDRSGPTWAEPAAVAPGAYRQA